MAHSAWKLLPSGHGTNVSLMLVSDLSETVFIQSKTTRSPFLRALAPFTYEFFPLLLRSLFGLLSPVNFDYVFFPAHIVGPRMSTRFRIIHSGFGNAPSLQQTLSAAL